MPRHKKDGKYINVKIQSDIYDAFDSLCTDLGQSKTVAVERALRLYINKMSENNVLDTAERTVLNGR